MGSTERVQRHRDELRRRGLRPIQIWVPDVNAPGFAEEAHRQSRLVSESPEESAVMDWIEAMTTDIWDDE